MHIAGVAFGGLRHSPEEAKWILSRVNDIAKLFPMMQNAGNTYQKIWDSDGDFWEEMDKVQAIKK